MADTAKSGGCTTDMETMDFVATENGKKVLTMAEYIDREAAIKAIYESDHFSVRECFGWSAREIEEVLRAVPAADVAPVVHCKDCKHLMFSDCYGECGAARMGIVSPDDFCSYGERRTDANEPDGT